MIIHNFEQGSESWYSIRAGKITGTRFKTLMSGDKTKGYKDLITDLAGEIITGKKEPTYSNAIMERGIEMEPEAANEYETIFEANLKEVGFIEPDEDNIFHGLIGVSPDRLINEITELRSQENKEAFQILRNPIGLLEIKCPMMKTHLSYIRANKFPTEYKHQVQGQLFVTGLKFVDFMSYYPGLKPFIVRVEPDLFLFDEYKAELHKILPLIKSEIENYKSYNYLT